MAATIFESVEDDVSEAVVALNVNGEMVVDDSGATFNSKNLTIFAHPGFTRATVRLAIEGHEVEETLTMQTTRPKSICVLVESMTDWLTTLAECVTILEDAGWSVTKTRGSTVFMSNKNKTVFMAANTWDIFISGKSRLSAAKILHDAGISREPTVSPGTTKGRTHDVASTRAQCSGGGRSVSTDRTLLGGLMRHVGAQEEEFFHPMRPPNGMLLRASTAPRIRTRNNARTRG